MHWDILQIIEVFDRSPWSTLMFPFFIFRSKKPRLGYSCSDRDRRRYQGYIANNGLEEPTFSEGNRKI